MPMPVETKLVRHGAGRTAGPGALHYDVIAPAEAGDRPPVVMIHGGSHTGACYLRTVDGRPGWAYRFVAHGYTAIVPDWPGMGRSGDVAPADVSGETVVRALGGLLTSLGRPAVVVTHSMSGAYGWRLLEEQGAAIACLIGVAPAPPGNIQPLPEIVSETADQLEIRAAGRVQRVVKSGLARHDRDFTEKKLVGASRRFPRPLMADYDASLVPTPARLLYERRNIHGAQLRVAEPARLAGKRILVVTGTDDLDHPVDVDGAIVTWLKEAGAAAEFIALGEHGITGNGHMLMLEENSDEIADLIIAWINRTLATP